MILITPLAEIKIMRSRELVCLQCECCGQQFAKSKNEVLKVLAGHLSTKARFCSNACKYASQTTTLSVPCCQCGKEFNIKLSAKQPQGNFCSRSCSASFNNQKRIRMVPTAKSCEYCGIAISAKRHFCSSACYSQRKYESCIQSWKCGEVDGSSGMGKLSRYIRRYMLSKFEHCCSACGFDTPHPLTKAPLLQVHHIDGDWRNNDESNLSVLCLNCHAMTLTFGSKNRGKGRHIACKQAGHSTR